MFKIIGSVAVIMASGFIGIKKYAELYERKRMLFAIRDGAERIYDNLRCMCMPLYDCFLQGGEFFKKAAQCMADGMLPTDAVKKIADELQCFCEEDRLLLYRFSDGLSSEDCGGQIRNAELFLSEIKKNTENACQALETKGKLFVKGSLLIAGAVVLVLI